jgi:uncharacterized protein (UPF0335 family)
MQEGHNSGVNANHLRAFIERIERLEDERSVLGEDLKELYAEIKGSGFDTKTIKKLVSIRKRDRDKVKEEQAILSLYLSAMGMEDVFS